MDHSDATNQEEVSRFFERLKTQGDGGTSMFWLSRSDTTFGLFLVDTTLIHGAFSSRFSDEAREQLMRDADLGAECSNEVTERQRQAWESKLPTVINQALSMLFWEALADAVDALRTDRGLNPLDRGSFISTMARGLSENLNRRRPADLYTETDSEFTS